MFLRLLLLCVVTMSLVVHSYAGAIGFTSNVGRRDVKVLNVNTHKNIEHPMQICYVIGEVKQA